MSATQLKLRPRPTHPASLLPVAAHDRQLVHSLKNRVRPEFFDYLQTRTEATVRVSGSNAHPSSSRRSRWIRADGSKVDWWLEPKVDYDETDDLPEISEFIRGLAAQSNVQMPTLSVVLVFLERLRLALPTQSNGLPCTRHRIFLAVLIVAAKALNDSSPKNMHWQKYARFFPLAEVNMMERELLHLLKWDCNVTEPEIIKEMQPFWWATASQNASSVPVASPSPVAPITPLRPAAPSRVAAPVTVTPLSLHQPPRSAPPSKRVFSLHGGDREAATRPMAPRSASTSTTPVNMARSHTSTSVVSTGGMSVLGSTPGLMERRASNDSLSSAASSVATPETRKASYAESPLSKSARRDLEHTSPSFGRSALSPQTPVSTITAKPGPKATDVSKVSKLFGKFRYRANPAQSSPVSPAM